MKETSSPDRGQTERLDLASGTRLRPTPKEVEPKSNVGICYEDCLT
jgi:hypothetical protein